MLLLAREFIRHGHRVDLVVLNAQGSLVAEVPPAAQLVELIPTKKWWLPMLLWAAIRTWNCYLKRQQPDVALASITGTNLVAALVHWLTKSPTRLVLREARGTAQVRHMLEGWAIGFLYPKADQIIAVSRGVADGLRTTLKIPNEKIQIIPNPVDLATILDRARQPAELVVPAGAEFLLSVGRLVPVKDFLTLLTAFNLVRQEHPFLHLLILGEGPERAILQQYIADRGLAGRVHLPGHMQNPYPYFKRAKIFVLSSKSEGMPNVLLEALCLGVPVISTDCPAGPREILDNGRLGTLIPVGDHVQMAQAIQLCLAETFTREPSPRVTGYDLEAITCRYLKLLHPSSERRTGS